MPASIEDQVVELQTRIAYQEDTLAELNDVVARQQREVDRLRVTVEKLTRLVEDDGDGGATPPGVDEKPPHY